jgi:dipeptidyl aminopeptidase/acylaminoacyl peptidase
MLSLEQALAIKSPAAVAWSSDGRRIALEVANPAGADIVVHEVESGESRTVAAGVPRPGYYVKEGFDLRWAPGDDRLVYSTGPEYYTVPAAAGDPELLFSAKLLGDQVKLSPDQRHVLFIRDGDIWLQPVSGGPPSQLTTSEEIGKPGPLLFSQWPEWSPDSTRVAYLSRMERGIKVVVRPIAGGEAVRIAPDEDAYGLGAFEWSPDGRRLAISRLSSDFTRKELWVADTATADQHLLHRDTDPIWVSHNVEPSLEPAFSPDGRQIAFVSNATGWKHVYVVPTAGGETRALTRGEHENDLVGWAPDGESVLVLSSRTHLQHRLPWLTPVDGSEPTRLLDRPGICNSGQLGRTRQALITWAPDGASVTLPFSGPDEPFGLWHVGRTVGNARRLFDAAADLPENGVAHLQPVSFPSADGTLIPGLLITAPDLDRGTRHPALTYHYGGWGQQASLGWSNGRKAAFFNYLACQGYVVLITDCGGSEGYGDELSKRLHLEGGGKQAEDLAAGARFLGTLPYVDTGAIAIFGHSYGAYLALQTMVSQPGHFAAGILMAGVFDWWDMGGGYGSYVRIRWGKPDPRPTLIDERSPGKHVDRLHGAVLVAHGTADYNAAHTASEKLVGELMKHDRDFEFISYPGEPHDWIKPEVERDFYRRVKRFLDARLRVAASEAPASAQPAPAGAQVAAARGLGQST